MRGHWRRWAVVVGLAAGIIAGALARQEDPAPLTVGELYCDVAEVRHELESVRVDDDSIPAAVEPRADLAGVVAVTAVDSGDLYVVARAGQLWRVRPEGSPVQVLDLADEVDVESQEQGLLGVAVSPDGTHLYLYGTFVGPVDQIVEYALVDGDPDPSSRRDVFSVPDPVLTHNGGRMAFGPDGMLYLGIGDGGNGAMTGAAQDLSSPFGKLLRIDPTPNGPAAYDIPADNPFVGTPGARGEIWALGLRNPWGWSIDAPTGDLWVGDVGQLCFEEVNLVEGSTGRGANFGWSFEEGAHLFEGPGLGKGGAADRSVVLPDLGSPPAGLSAPVLEYEHSSTACSVLGGFVYRGAAIPALAGRYVYSDLCGQRLLTLERVDGGWSSGSIEAVIPGPIVALGQSADGEVLVVSLDHGVYELVVER